MVMLKPLESISAPPDFTLAAVKPLMKAALVAIAFSVPPLKLKVLLFGKTHLLYPNIKYRQYQHLNNFLHYI